MKKLALLIALCGLLLLSVLMVYGKETRVDNYEGLETLELNSKVIVSGKIISERVVRNDFRIVILDNGLEAVCDCEQSLKTKEVIIEGLVEEFNGKRQVRILTIQILA